MYSETQKLVKGFYQRGTYPSYSVAYWRGGDVQKFQQGFAQLVPEKIALPAGALYDLASLTKVIGTTTVVLQLLEAGVLSLDDSLARHLPSFKDQSITLRQLLTHTSGVHYQVANRDQLNAQDLKKVLLAATADSAVQGKVFRYTDTGLLLLGFMLEAMLGEPVQELIKKRVLRPAKMRTATFKPTADLAVATASLEDFQGRGVVHDPKARILGEHCGSAGLFASLEDCLSFVACYQERAAGIAGPVLQTTTVQNLLQDYGGVATPHSLGWRLRYNPSGKAFLYHTGYTGTWLIFQPETQEGMLFLSNRVHPHDQRTTYLPIREKIIETFLNETTPL